MRALPFRKAIEDLAQILRRALPKALQLLKVDPRGCIVSQGELDSFPKQVITIIARLQESITIGEARSANIISEEFSRKHKDDDRIGCVVQNPPWKGTIRLSVKSSMVCCECGQSDVMYDVGRSKRYKISGCCKIVGQLLTFMPRDVTVSDLLGSVLRRSLRKITLENAQESLLHKDYA